MNDRARRMRLASLAGGLLLASLAAACGDDPADAPARACTPGASSACVGAGGCAGGQACNAEGTAYGPCVCAGPPAADADAGGGDPDSATTGSDAGADGSSCVAPGPPRVVFLNKGGGAYIPGATADARTNTTPLADSKQTATAWTIEGSAWKALRDCVEAKFAPFNIEVTDVDPGPSASHIEIVFAQAGLGALGGVPSVAPFTCAEVPNAIAFVSQSYAEANLSSGCAAAAAAVGYALGLESVTACPDAMAFDYNACADAPFTNVALQCGTTSAAACQCASGTTQSSQARMLAIAGPRCL